MHWYPFDNKNQRLFPLKPISRALTCSMIKKPVGYMSLTWGLYSCLALWWRNKVWWCMSWYLMWKRWGRQRDRKAAVRQLGIEDRRDTVLLPKWRHLGLFEMSKGVQGGWQRKGRNMNGSVRGHHPTGRGRSGGIPLHISRQFKQQKQVQMTVILTPGSDTQFRCLYSGVYIDWCLNSYFCRYESDSTDQTQPCDPID